MSSIVQALSNASRFLLNETFNGLTYLVVLNYELVSFLLQISIFCFNGVSEVIRGLFRAFFDFVDYFGDFCVMILEILMHIGHIAFQVFTTIGHVIFTLFNTAASAIKIVVECPILIRNSIRSIMGVLESIPAKIIDTFLDGLSLTGSMVLDSANMTVGWTGGMIRNFGKTLNGLIWKNKVDRSSLDQAASTVKWISLDVGIGVLICVVIYLAIRNRSPIIRMLRRKLSTFRRRLSIFWFNIQTALFLAYQTIRLCFRRRPRINNAVPDQPQPNNVAPLQRAPLKSRIPVPASKPSTSKDTGAAASADAERYLCVICQDNEKTVMVQNCRHVCMCADCADEVYYQQRRCPICRAFIVSLTDVYL